MEVEEEEEEEEEEEGRGVEGISFETGLMGINVGVIGTA